MQVPGWPGWLARVSRTWSGRLEPREARELATATAWVLPIVPVNLAVVVIGIGLQFTGTATAMAMIPWLVAVAATVVAYTRYRHHTAAAQRLVAERLQIEPKGRRRIDFRGYERFDRSIAEAPRTRTAAAQTERP